MDYKISQNTKMFDYMEKRERDGASLFCFEGGRRSGKTFFICQRMLGYCLAGGVVNIASMTSEQGRLGAYADCKTIINMVGMNDEFEIMSSPREIRSKRSNGVIFFNSYKNAETAKGIACDWLFVNEANNFTQQQVTDLRANVRKGTLFDYNPMLKYDRWWIKNYFAEDEICHSTWKDNAQFLSQSQLEYFDELKRLGGSPDSDPINRANYLRYYEGVYAEVEGKIFTRENLHRVNSDDVPWEHLHNFIIFSDPSALRGADYFASVLSATDARDGKVYILDAFSTNVGDRCDILRQYKEWGARYQVELTYVETNGYVGIDFFEYAINSEFPVTGWDSKGNKFERITANFQNITTNAYFVDSERMDIFLEQCYEFEKNCEHDDNIDAVNSSINAHKLL